LLGVSPVGANLQIARRSRAVLLSNQNTFCDNFAMSRLASVLVIIAVWAVTYLANLGASEFRSEEGRRVMPAVQMLQSGNYMVPYLGTEPYLRKPPLINWIVAGSFKLFGVRNEWTARLPSAVFILAVALLLRIIAAPTLGGFGSTMAALCWLTNLGLIEKGRMIEIEATYVSLFGFAFFLWLILWQGNRSPWLTFVVPWLLIGLGMLAKGPANVAFFYVLICAVLWKNHRLTDLLRPAHMVGLLCAAGIFAAWLIPFLETLHSQAAIRVWAHEAAVAFHGQKDRSENWSLNFPHGFAYFLPWILLVPFIRFQKITDPMQRETVRGLAFGSTLVFVIILLIPGTLPRYVLPLVAPFCWIIGVACANNAFEWSIRFKRFQLRVPRVFVGFSIAVGVLAAMVIFPLRSVTYLKRHERLKPVAAKVNAVVPPHQHLYAVNLPFLPYLFYVHAPVIYLRTLDELPPDARYFLVTPNYQRKIAKIPRLAHASPVVWTPKYPPTFTGGESVLFVLNKQ
jgi:4-amino-4-deoxy-L-arabinose transferase-like glycosyltransferase